MARAPKTIHERYEVSERIAVGGMAEVYLAKAYGAHGFEKTLALKRILPALAASREFEERFIAEAKLSVKLSHANIVQVFDFGWIEDSLFLAMEYVEGIDLANLLSYFRASGQRVPLSAAFHIAMELMRGLDFAHSRHVIHRDVSPSNILLSRAGEVKIADFGIAVPLTHHLAKSRQRRIMGKWRYMSPEQTRGDELDTRSDLFSAAAVLYELFVGEKLFVGDTIDDIVASIHHMDIPRATERRPELPARLDDVLAAALARDPAERLGPAAEIQRLLTELSYENSIVATALAVKETVATATAASAALLTDSNDSVPHRPRSRRKPTVDEFIRAQLGGTAMGELRPATEERRTVRDATAPAGQERDSKGQSEPGPGAEPYAEPAADIDDPSASESGVEEADASIADVHSYRPATIVRTDVEHKGVSIWTQAKRPERLVLTRVAGAIGAVAVLALAVVLWLSTTAPEDRDLVLARPPDAGVPADAQMVLVPKVAYVQVTSEPTGAIIKINDEEYVKRTPADLTLGAGQAHEIEIYQRGYEPYVEPLKPAVGERKAIHGKLRPLPASLHVITEPEGAEVLINGKRMGTSPFMIESHIIGPARVDVSRKGYIPVQRDIELLPGEREVVELVLESKASARPRPVPMPVPAEYGTVDLILEIGWADIFIKGKRIGTAPVRDFRLPVGKHRLRLYNHVTGQKKDVEIEVVAEQINRFTISL